ncbi:DUF488 domain-containing protein [Sphingobium estronivorans]|uniref:DUF488 domain-containing protein n=1 Tax=Sphingobium estronivorans TaxID=1577690 RepID=UPI00123ABCCC|nr:DUF488 domain-containing protein [Sphingobium estronivorans]
MNGTFDIKRIYARPSDADGQRVLVDRIWPRGVSREDAALNLWLKEIAPSTNLRKWFGHDPSRFEAFRHRYRQELDANPKALAELYALADHGHVTLLYAAHDEHVNHALVLAEYLKDHGCKLGHPTGAD